MKYQLYREQQLHCDINTAWAFFSAPENLSQITPKDMKFIVLSKNTNEPIFAGMQIEYTVSPLFQIPLKWKTKITQVDFQKKVLLTFKKKGHINFGTIIMSLYPTKRAF